MVNQTFDGSAQDADNSPPFRLHNRYRAERLLGKKAGRQTWLAVDEQTTQPVVMKLLTFSHDFGWDDLKLFQREAETLQALSYEAIPRYLDYFEFDTPQHKGFALVQTYIPARSLEQHLKAGRTFSEAEVIQIAQSLLQILIYLHDRQPAVIHRDIKPSNILLTDKIGNSPGQVYLVDFGSVQTLAAREGGTITVVGTYGYMPPEQFGGRATPASDLYSLGATLIYLATGKHPADLPQTDLRLEFASIAAISSRFVTWLTWLTEPSLNRRSTSAREALYELTHTESSTFTSSPSSQPLFRPTRSKIVLTRELAVIEVLLPSRRLTLGHSRPWTLIAVLMIFPYVLVPWGLVAFILWGVSALFGRAQLRVDRQHITVARKLFNWRYSQRSTTPRRHLWKLEVQHGAHTSRLMLWIGTQRHAIHGTAAEIVWLASELSDWLEMPIDG